MEEDADDAAELVILLYGVHCQSEGVHTALSAQLDIEHALVIAGLLPGGVVVTDLVDSVIGGLEVGSEGSLGGLKGTLD